MGQAGDHDAVDAGRIKGGAGNNQTVADENSIGYKLSRGDKYQAFIMTDPKGRIHSSWEIVRILNESYDGMIERNDGLHGQWLS